MSDTPRADDPRLTIGGNSPPISEQLSMEYETIAADVDKAAIGFEDLPKVQGEADAKLYADHARVIKGVQSRVEAAEEKEKRPFMNALDAVRGHFGQFTNKNGTGRLDKMLADMRRAVGDWQRAEAARKQREADERARIAREEERKRQAEAEEAARKLREAVEAQRAAELAARRACEPMPEPTPETRAAAERVNASLQAADEANRSAQRFEQQAAAPAADHVRVRSGVGGGMATARRFWTFTVEDWEKVPPAELWAFVPEKQREQAIRAYVAIHKGDRPLPGVKIFEDSEASFR